MKIFGNKPPESPDAARPRKAGKNEPARRADRPAVADKVDLSGKTREIEDIVSAAGKLPEVRAEKVAGIRERIESGKYSVDPAKIAQKMIDEIV